MNKSVQLDIVHTRDYIFRHLKLKEITVYQEQVYDISVKYVISKHLRKLRQWLSSFDRVNTNNYSLFS